MEPSEAPPKPSDARQSVISPELQALERIAAATERLAEDPVIHVESGPPVCPFCERMNPEIRVSESENRGPLGEYVLQAQCLSCNEIFYAIPQMWLTVRTTDEVRTELEDRINRGNQ